MSVPIYRYALDPTGVNPNNLVTREPHSLNPKANLTDVRVFAPLYGPFFALSVEIWDRANGRKLVNQVDYKITDHLQEPALTFGADIGQFVVITNGTVSNEIEVTYQVLGGNYQNDSTAVQHVFETFLNDTRPVDWVNITGKPNTFPPSLHLHLLEDIINFGPLIVAIDDLKDAILYNNTPMFEALIEWVKTKKVHWDDITGKPTTAGVPSYRSINTPPDSGLQGGGNFSSDRNLSLTNTGIVAAEYGGPKKTLTLSADAQGRITAISSVAAPTTLDGYGILDAVRTGNLDQIVQGIKTFSQVILGNGSTSSNIHNQLQSQIVTLDYLRTLLPTLQTGGNGGKGYLRMGSILLQWGTSTSTQVYNQYFNTETTNFMLNFANANYTAIVSAPGQGMFVHQRGNTFFDGIYGIRTKNLNSIDVGTWNLYNGEVGNTFSSYGNSGASCSVLAIGDI